MTVEHIELLVEEPSMEAALRVLLPKIVGTTTFEVYPFQGKADLLKKLPDRMRGYKWVPTNWRILVIVDRDDDDCIQLKAQLDKAASDAGLVTRSRARGKQYQVVNRIAIEELEAWYFGDWEAVTLSYPRASKTVSSKSKYRKPDEIRGGTWQAFERELQGAGYFVGGLAKIEAARAISEKMAPERNSSPSFQQLHRVLAEMASET